MVALAQGYGFDAGASCSQKNARRGRAQILSSIPCDLTVQSYCNLPGSLYPWHAVRRFVHENQGMMKRMYGDVKHISVLRTEINNNDIGFDDVEQATARYSRSGWKRNKYLYTDFQKTKNNDVLTEPYFRRAPTQRTTTKTAETTSQSTDPTTTNVSSSEVSESSEPTERRNNVAELQSEGTNSGINNELEHPDFNVIPNEAVENETPTGTPLFNHSNIPSQVSIIRDIIKIVGAPNFIAKNKTEAATISTTLKMFNLKPVDTTTSPLLTDEIETQSVAAVLDDNGSSTITVALGETFSNNTDFLEGTEADSDVIIISKQANKTQRPEDNAPAAGQLFQDVVQKKETDNFNIRGV